jgi:peptidoglycan/xylan/chitin deacetylase (PgdA/CDA1 family)
MRRKIIVTTSWDDGHKLDIKLAALLKKYNLKGTIYVCPKDNEFEKKELLSEKEVKQISKNLEIGAHTINHPTLTKINIKQAKKEIEDSKKYMERIISKKITSFCYPKGYFNRQLIDIVKNSGYVYARTTRQMFIKYPKNIFTSDTTIQAMPLNFIARLGQIKNGVLRNQMMLPHLFFNDWEKIAIKCFDQVYKNGGVFHLWGHSWQIENDKQWDALETVFKYISNRKGVKYLSNSELVTAI